MPWAALIPIAAAVAGSVTSSVAGKKKAGNKAPAPGIIQHQEFKTPGFNLENNYWASTNSGRTDLTRPDTAENRAIDEGLLSTLNQVREAKGLVRPGYGALTEAVTRAIADARAVAGGNLRESLKRRKVAGASFGMDAETRLNSEFAKLDTEARTQSFLSEFAVTLDLINTEHSYLQQQLDTQVQLLGIATGANANLQAIAAQNSQFERSLASQEAAAAGQFAGQNIGNIFEALGGLGAVFGSGGGGGPGPSGGPAGSAGAAAGATGGSGGPTGAR